MFAAVRVIHDARVRTRRARPTAKTLLLTLTAALALALTGVATRPVAAADVSQSPVAYVVGDQTTLSGVVGGVALDGLGSRYVVNTSTDSVAVFAPGAQGNVAPVREIKGAATGLKGPRDVMVDATGRVYVSGVFGPDTASIRVFAPGASGNVAPVAVLAGFNTGLVWPVGMALDSAGRLFVADREANRISVFAPGVTGNSAPVRTISGNSTGLATPTGVAIDGAGVLHVANFAGGSVTSYAPGATGNAAPVRALAGPATGLSEPYGTALDAAGNLYVTNISSSGPGPDAVVMFGPTTPSGNSAPAQRLVGNGTDLNDPVGIAVDPQRRLTVSVGTPALLTFAPLPLPAPPTPPTPPATPAGAVGGLKAKGKPSAAKRKITWSAPASTGGAPVTGYVLTVTKGSKTLLTKTLSGTRVVLKRKKLKPGRLTVTVRAVTSAGQGAPATVRLRVTR